MITAEVATAPISTVSQDLQTRRRQFKPQQSTVQTRRQQAVCVRRAYKRYGSKNNPNVILDGLNMTVPKGTIYGLLGASGCGKTTLLSCIVGRKRLNSGEIWVLGGKPGSRGSGVPGPRVGYMPQEIALYGEFSIRETFIYFGWIAGMTTKQVDEKLDFLLKFLMLPTASRFIKNLSGGQQRRVSFAAALLNDPELLILDEPTVGVDPVLRQNIWDHLVNITKGGRTTVIITTHYIDETRQAHLIGLMRGGHFLAEESPDHLLQQYGAPSLEDVFLKLSVIQNMGKRRRSSILHEVTENIVVPSTAVDNVIMGDEIGEISGEFGDNVSISSRVGRISITHESPDHAELPPDEEPPMTCIDYFKLVKGRHMKTLIWKNFLWMWRNVGFLAFILGLPLLQTILFCVSIGHDPTGLGVAVANYEKANASAPCIPSTGCNLTMLSCRFLHHLEKRKVEFTNFETDEDARNYVRRGKAWVALRFSDNYTASLIKRVEDGRDVDAYTMESAELNVWVDMSNQQIAALLMRDMHYSFFDFLAEMSVDCNYSAKIAKIPVRINEPAPVYGDFVPNFTDFAAPGVILTIVFFLSVAVTSGAMLIERNEGLLERSLVSGITGTEILFSHVVTQFVLMICQCTLVLVCAFGVFNLTMRGELVWVTTLTMLTGLCGMCFGFVVSCVCENERTATYMALGSFLPIVMLCGIIWPVEGMHIILQWIASLLPLTKSTESLRTMLQRGWGITNPIVYNGFTSTIAWIIVFLTISILCIKFKKG